MYNRIVIKLSGEALCSAENKFDRSIINRIVLEIIEVKKLGVEVALVVGGGNFWRGRSTGDEMSRSRSDQIGMLATIMNGIYLCEAFAANDIDAVVMTPFPAHAFAEQFDIRRADKRLKEGTVLIFSGGCGLPYFSTDTITAVRAGEIGADAVLFAKNINGIYDSDPKKNPGAKKYDEISYDDIIRKNLKAIDISAIAILQEQKAESVCFGLNEPDGILKAAAGGNELYKIGTRITI